MMIQVSKLVSIKMIFMNSELKKKITVVGKYFK